MAELSQQTREALAAKILDESVKLQVRSIGVANATWIEKINMSVGDMCRDTEQGYYELRIAPATIKVEACELPKPMGIEKFGSMKILNYNGSYEIRNFDIFKFNTQEDVIEVFNFLNKTFRSE